MKDKQHGQLEVQSSCNESESAQATAHAKLIDATLVTGAYRHIKPYWLGNKCWVSSKRYHGTGPNRLSNMTGTGERCESAKRMRSNQMHVCNGARRGENRAAAIPEQVIRLQVYEAQATAKRKGKHPMPYDELAKTEPQPGAREEHREGLVARSTEQQTAKLPSDLFLWAAFGSIAGSLAFKLSGKDTSIIRRTGLRPSYSWESTTSW